jgi:hypothetical protein
MSRINALLSSIMGHLTPLLTNPLVTWWLPWVTWEYWCVGRTGIGLILVLVLGELWLAVLCGLLFVAIELNIVRQVRFWASRLLPIGVLLWMLMVLQYPRLTMFPTTAEAYLTTWDPFGGLIYLLLMPLVSVIVLYLGIRSLLFLRKLPEISRRTTRFATIAAFVFWFPYVLWSQGMIANYRTAGNYAMVAVVALLMVQHWRRQETPS